MGKGGERLVCCRGSGRRGRSLFSVKVGVFRGGTLFLGGKGVFY